jgi:hypothetical protein
MLKKSQCVKVDGREYLDGQNIDGSIKLKSTLNRNTVLNVGLAYLAQVRV